VSRISNLAKDLARSLAVISVRVVEVIPGKSVVGIEIPNEDREIVNFREVLSSRAFDQSRSALTLALGHDISGQPVVADLSRMPHLLVAGTTGSGKSVGVNAMLLSLLYKSTPADVRLILVDPKMLELSVYDGIPHLLTPVITDMKDAANGLRWCVAEMERRYKLMAALGVRNLAGYNRKVSEAGKAGTPIVDPLWVPDPLSMDARGGAERAGAGVAAVYRCGHRRVCGHDDDRRQEGGGTDRAHSAEGAGSGDPSDPGHAAPLRRRDHGPDQGQHPHAHRLPGQFQGRLADHPRPGGCRTASRPRRHAVPAARAAASRRVSTVPSSPTTRCTGWWRTGSAAAKPAYIEGLLDEGSSTPVTAGELQSEAGGDSDEDDALYDEAVHYVTKSRRASISSVQRKLRIGYNRAARLIEAMEAAGVVSEMGSNGQREVLAPPPVED
jgi:S-DNA-T family DNA segregation ATPase FtsK/SpoIIIE